MTDRPADANLVPSVVARQRRLGAPRVEEPASSRADGELHFDRDGLVLPRRLRQPAAQPAVRDLQRELKFNQAQGKNVLEQKSELKRALEKLEASRRKKEAESERLNRRSSLELRLEERAERLAKETAEESDTSGIRSVTR